MYTFHAVTQMLGPLLSCYALTNDTMFLDKAREVGDKLKSMNHENGKCCCILCFSKANAMKTNIQFLEQNLVPIERVFNSEHFDMRFVTMPLMVPELLVQWFQWLYQFC